MEYEWFEEAKRCVGVKEIKGKSHSPTIMGWVKRLGAKVLGITVTDDETAWCGTFAAHCMQAAGIEPPKIAVRAKSWTEFGANLRAEALTPGAVLVFGRTGGGHVGFYVAEDDTCYHVLGGNQSDMVCVTRIQKDRCIARRWPRGVVWTGGPVHVKSSAPVSVNEA